MRQDELKSNAAVVLAESIGFMGYGQNAINRRHFHWFLPDSNVLGDHEFSLQQHENGQISYRVREVGEFGLTSSSIAKAMELLRTIERNMKNRAAAHTL